MGIGRAFNTRAVKYEATNTVTGESGMFVIEDRMPLAPQWASASYRGAMGIPAVWRSAALLSGLLGAFPWHAYRERPGHPVERMASPLLDQPSPPETRINTFSSLGLDYLLQGNGVGVYTARNSAGYPSALVPVSVDDVQVRLNRGVHEYEIGGKLYGSDDVLHIKGLSKPGALRGMSVLEQHWETLTLADELNRQAANVNKHGVPTGKLKVTNPDATEEDLRDAKAGWLKAQRERTVAVLNATTDFEPLSWDPTETQLLESRKFSLHEIALLFGLPMSFLGVEQASRVYTNVEQEGLNLIKFTLGDHIVRFEQALSLAFPKGTWVKANLDSILRADTKTRYEAHEIGIRAGFLTVNEARGFEDWAPLPEKNEESNDDEVA